MLTAFSGTTTIQQGAVPVEEDQLPSLTSEQATTNLNIKIIFITNMGEGEVWPTMAQVFWYGKETRGGFSSEHQQHQHDELSVR